MAIKSRKTLFAIGGVAVLAVLIGGVVAYNQDLFNFNNNFKLGFFRTEVSETFDSPTAWMPCDKTEKIVTVKNTGNIAVNARIKMKESWVSADGKRLGLIKDGVKLATIELANDDWELRDGYYYLKKTLNSGESSEFIKSVTFSCDANLAQNEMVGGTSNDGSVSDGYEGASYHLGITAQLVQADVSFADAYNEWREPSTFAKLKSGISSWWNGIKQNRELTAFKRSSVLPEISAVSSMTEVQDVDESTPIYFWYSTSDKTMYWYSTADAITWNKADGIGGVFNGMFFTQTPTDVSGFQYFDMRELASVGGFFYGSFLPSPEAMSVVSHWDVSGLSSWSGAFNNSSNYGYYFTDEYWPAVEYWKIPETVSLNGAFSRNSALTNLDGLKNWDVSNISNFRSVFEGMSNLTDISGISGWNMSNATDISYLFAGSGNIQSLEPLRRWNVSNVTNMSAFLAGNAKIVDLSPLANWNVGNVTNFNWAFAGSNIGNDMSSKIRNLSPLANWDVSKGTSFENMFSSTKVSDASVLNNWSVSEDASLKYMFSDTECSNATFPTWYTLDKRGV
jgi:surface protein